MIFAQLFLAWITLQYSISIIFTQIKMDITL